MSPCVAIEFPQAIGSIALRVRVTSAERTFWEKVTILHQQAHSDRPPPLRYARHYYDIYMLTRAGVAQNALADLSLLRDVVAFKERCYWSASARYDLANPGTLRVVPDAARLRMLARDYDEMRVMFFQEPPSWAAIVEELLVLESQINGGGAEASR